MYSTIGIALLLVIAAAACAQEPDPGPIGPTPIRFYSGNLSVSQFMYYWGTKERSTTVDQDVIATSGATRESNVILKRSSVSAMSDYLAWCLAEQQKGAWDWELYKSNQRVLASDGIGYNIFAWLHYPPRWFESDPRFVRYTDLENGATIPQLSIFAPFTAELYDEFYGRLAREMGKEIAFLRLALPADYGEVGYPAGMTKWLRTQEYARPAYWCGDEFARKSFVDYVSKRYPTVQAVNAAWGTGFETKDDLEMPDVSKSAEHWRSSGSNRRRWLDFADWYCEAQADGLRRLAPIVKKHFPGKELIVSLGYGGEVLKYGNDEGRIVAELAKLGISVQAPGDIGYFPTRRVSSACRAYGVPYYTEPPAAVLPDRQVSRIWMDASNGTQTWFDYPPNLDGARDLFIKYKQHLTGKPPVCSLGIWLPTLDHWLSPDRDWPEGALGLADALRETCDYEVLDERMIRDGAIDKLGIRLLIVPAAQCLDAQAVRKALAWVETGGVLVALSAQAVVGCDGPADEWNDVIQPLRGPAETLKEAGTDPARVWATASAARGKGRVIVLPADLSYAGQAALVSHYNYNIASYGPYRNAVQIDTDADGILSTLMTDRILLFNTTPRPVTKKITLRAEDFASATRAPERLEWTLEFAPREIKHIRLVEAGPPAP